ncbi:hypothetical protein PV08_06216 [Exophiala spinifera]|uniref:Polyprenal reductase n=1 Tax=Exophiala spinifera TaxID=91928 RepID=A0A0D2BC13_9EURO|nr:uncharacterized protein PV08_06216 [Exophiala spinifera]KIW16165.1 hypothetical protein PV08_06216 [Exophiala spinifera]
MLDQIVWCTRAFYLFSIAVILVVRLIPGLKNRFLSYGARDSGGGHGQVQEAGIHGNGTTGSRSRLSSLSLLPSQVLDHVMSWKVPHSWFIHFYILSVVLSTTTIIAASLRSNDPQHALSSRTMNMNANIENMEDMTTSAPSYLFCSILMLIQGSRRLLECMNKNKKKDEDKDKTTTNTTSRPATSQMWIGHYAIGLAFYFFTNLGIFVEGVAKHQQQRLLQPPPSPPPPAVQIPRGFLSFLTTPKTFVCTSVFLYTSYKQNKYHRHLASLKKYTLPDTGIFRTIVAPHYTAECGIYLSLALLQARDERGGTNWSLIAALLFVTVNLGVTADGTRRWMMAKFPERRREVEARWRMIPAVW